MDKENKMSPVQQIVQHINDKHPSQMKNVVDKEIASRVMGMIQDKRKAVGATLFGRR